MLWRSSQAVESAKVAKPAKRPPKPKVADSISAGNASLSAEQHGNLAVSGELPGRTDPGNCAKKCAKLGTCAHCGAPFRLKQKEPGVFTRFCSHACVDASRRGQTHPKFISPPAERAERVRANGLINKRLKLGIIRRPAWCEACGKRAKVEACHVDYAQPHVVAWCCHSCHMLSHFNPAQAAVLRTLAKPRGPEPRRLYRRSAGGGAPC